MRFRDEISGRFLSLEVALSNPDLVIPLDDKGKTSPGVAVEWARMVTAIVVNKGRAPSYTGTGPGSSIGGDDGSDDGDSDIDSPPDESWDQFDDEDLMWWGDDGDLGEEEEY